MRNARSSGKIRLGEKGAADPDVPTERTGRLRDTQVKHMTAVTCEGGSAVTGSIV